MKQKVIEEAFFGSWLTVGCCIDCIFESPVAGALVAVGLIIAIGSAVWMGRSWEYDEAGV